MGTILVLAIIFIICGNIIGCLPLLVTIISFPILFLATWNWWDKTLANIE